jgi:uncharacterized protein (TIGR00251 family)
MNSLKLKKGDVIFLQVISSAKESSLSYKDGIYKIRLKSKALKGQANNELKDYFKKLGYNIEIIKGQKNKHKIIKIN